MASNTCLTVLFLTTIQYVGLPLFPYPSLQSLQQSYDWNLRHRQRPGEPFSSHLQHEHTCRVHSHKLDSPKTLDWYLQYIHIIWPLLPNRVDHLHRHLNASVLTVGRSSSNLPIIHCQRSHWQKQDEMECLRTSWHTLCPHQRQCQSQHTQQIPVNLLHQHHRCIHHPYRQSRHPKLKGVW